MILAGRNPIRKSARQLRHRGKGKWNARMLLLLLEFGAWRPNFIASLMVFLYCFSTRLPFPLV